MSTLEHSFHSSGSRSSQVGILAKILVCECMTPLLGFLQDIGVSLALMLKALLPSDIWKMNARGKEREKDLNECSSTCPGRTCGSVTVFCFFFFC